MGRFSPDLFGVSLPMNNKVPSSRDDFITVWRIKKGEKLTLPISGQQMIIDWGDGTREKASVSYSNHHLLAHQYDQAGVYKVAISNKIQSMCLYNLYGFGGGGDAMIHDLLDVKQWGTTKWHSTRNMFYKANNMTMSATDVPNLAICDDMSYMFYDCYNFNSPIEHWDVSEVKIMRFLLSGARKFNQSLNSWDVSAVESMWGMFERAKRFNQPLDKWDVGKVSNMQGMFDGAHVFNQPIGNWDMRTIKWLAEMFKSAYAFNQSINDWQLPRLTKSLYMFDGNKVFDQDLSKWELVLVDGSDEMFGPDKSFDNYREKYKARHDKTKMMGILK